MKLLLTNFTIHVFFVASLCGQVGQGFGTNYAITETDRAQCISPEQRKLVDSINRVNRERFHIQRSIATEAPVTHSLFNFPLVYNGSDCNFYTITNYVDQNPDTVAILDYRCGQITYDGHTGTDFAIWPFDWYKMDDTVVSIVAALDGIIINTADGNYDRDCVKGNQPPNYVILQHADGSESWYWHMKKGTVTTLPIGTFVTAGTHLGYVGSSGSSTGPHLHFEVHDSTGALIDPFDTSIANCNNLNNSSWWNNQIPYYSGGLAKILTNNTALVFNPCPETSYPVSTQCFQPSDTLYVYMFGYNSNNNAPTITISEPDGTVYYTGTGGGSTYIDWYYYYYFLFYNGIAYGKWTVSASFDGKVCNTYFYMNPPKTSITASICADSSYKFNGVMLNVTGTYTDTLTSDNGCDSIIVLNLTVNPINTPDGGPGTWTWTGAMSNDWFTRCNWDKGSLPNSLSDVVIPGGTVNEPTITGATALCKSISINADNGGLLIVAIGGSGLLNVAQ